MITTRRGKKVLLLLVSLTARSTTRGGVVSKVRERDSEIERGPEEELGKHLTVRKRHSIQPYAELKEKSPPFGEEIQKFRNDSEISARYTLDRSVVSMTGAWRGDYHPTESSRKVLSLLYVTSWGFS